MTKRNLANSTKENYNYYYRHSIKDSRIGKMKVIDIRKSDILLFYHDLEEKGYSAGTLKILHKIIFPALQLACDDNIIGLTWDDVDMNKKEININHQVQYRMFNGKVQYYANKTKTNAGKRIIPMTDDMHKMFLEQRKEWFKINKDLDFEVDGYKNFVFISHLTGRCMGHNSIRRMMRTIVSMNQEREIQLPSISPHILRHTCCCRLAESGCDIKVLQYIMGHTDIRTTMRVYNHVDMGRVKREMNKLEQLHQNTPIYTPIAPNFM